MADEDDKPGDVDDAQDQDPAGDDPGDGGDTGKPDGKPDDKPAGKPAVPQQGGPAEDTKPEHQDQLGQQLRKANREASERRKELTALKAQIAEMETANATEAEKALIKARQDAAAEADARWRPQIVTLRADAALAAANCRDAADRELLLARIDATKVELDDAGNVVDGLEDQVTELKVKYPRMFTEPRRPTAREVDGGTKTPAAVPKTATEQLVARLKRE